MVKINRKLSYGYVIRKMENVYKSTANVKNCEYFIMMNIADDYCNLLIEKYIKYNKVGIKDIDNLYRYMDFLRENIRKKE